MSGNDPAWRQLSGQYEHARALFERGDLPAAQRILEALLRAAPRHSASLHFLGLIALRNGERQAAVELFARAVRADPRNAVAHFCAGQTLHELGGYPTATLYRQERPGEWPAVLERVRADLERWLDGRSDSRASRESAA